MTRLSKILSLFTGCYLLVILHGAFADANIYKTTQPDGTILYADTPSKDSKKLVISNSDNQSDEAESVLTQDKKVTKKDTAKENTDTQIVYNLQIVSPQTGATFQNQLPISVKVNIKPDLQNKDKLQLFVNGSAYGSQQANMQFTLSNLERGTYTLQVGVVSDATKKVINKSNVVTIYKKQRSVLNKVTKYSNKSEKKVG